MQDEDKAKSKVEEIYKEAMQRLDELAQLQRQIIAQYVAELEQEKIKMLQDKLTQ